MFRSRSNWMVIDVEPCVDVEVIDEMPAMVVNCASSGVATADAMVSGSAPGNDALTRMVGKSTFGNSLIGNCEYPKAPKINIAAMRRIVMTGRRMNGSEMF